MKVDWNGVYPAITTKFNEDGSLDLDTYKKNIEAQVQAGVHGFILGGTLGEASTLKNDEKLDLVAKTLDFVDHKLPVIMNVAEQTTAEAIDRKSTRLNSSHVAISYAVFCLKKKKHINPE